MEFHGIKYPLETEEMLKRMGFGICADFRERQRAKWLLGIVGEDAKEPKEICAKLRDYYE